MQKSWSLDDVSGMAFEAPYTYYLPSAELLSQLAVGDLVKLVFRCPIENDKGLSAERMWVEIVAIDGEKFRGILKNNPNYIPDLQFDQEMEFLAHHIIQTQREDLVAHPSEKYASRCFVTARILEDGEKVGYLYLEEVDEEGVQHQFSGWSLSAGDESDDYLENDENWHFVSLGRVLNQDDRFLDLLDIEAKGVKEYRWDSFANTFLVVTEDQADA